MRCAGDFTYQHCLRVEKSYWRKCCREATVIEDPHHERCAPNRLDLPDLGIHSQSQHLNFLGCTKGPESS